MTPSAQGRFRLSSPAASSRRWRVRCSAVSVARLEPLYVGSFLFLAVVSLIGASVLLGLRMPQTRPNIAEQGDASPWRTIVSQPAYLVALFGAATGYGIMILAMTATPIAMVHHNHGLAAAATVIQLHVLGMFLPSFFTGSLIARFGVVRIMFAGVGLFAAHVVITLTGTGFGSFAGALVFLGIGWNFLNIGGTTLLTSTYCPAEKGRAQANNDRPSSRSVWPAPLVRARCCNRSDGKH